MMDLVRAERIAEAMREWCAPACHRIAIAGSIRRRRYQVKDIELVYIPKTREFEVDLFGLECEETSLLYTRFTEHMDLERCVPIKPGVKGIERWPLKPQGRYWRFWLGEANLRVDMFRADEDNWGLIYAIRTGSADFSRGLLARWKHLTGGRSHEGRLRTRRGETVTTPTEARLFEVLRMRPVPPEARDSSSVIRSYVVGDQALRGVAV